MVKLLYNDLTEKIRQAAFDVHRYLGYGFLEKVYENSMIYKLKQLGIECKQQVPFKVHFENNVVVGEFGEFGV